jgi:hypothetical protein
LRGLIAIFYKVIGVNLKNLRTKMQNLETLTMKKFKISTF